MDLTLQPLNLPGSENRPMIIAGPCSAETEEQVLQTALELASKGIKIFRAGVWKPRTKPGGFEGKGEEALPWMQQVKAETGMLIGTEVATPKHVEAALNAGMDILWIGARTSANPFAVQELADSLKGVDVPVFVKNPVNPDIELWVGALERINGAGITRLAAIHRGFSSIDQKLYRNAPMWHLPIELHRRYLVSTKNSIGMPPCGISPLNCIAAILTCRLSAIRAISADAVTSSLPFANRLWIWALKG